MRGKMARDEVGKIHRDQTTQDFVDWIKEFGFNSN